MLSLERIRQKPQCLRTIGLSLCAAFSCMLAAATLNGVQVPLSAALAAAVSPLAALAVLTGGLFAYVLTGTITKAPIFICILVLTVLIRWLMGERDKPLLAALAAGGSTLIATLLFGCAGLITGADWLFWGLQTVLTAALANCVAQVRLRAAEGFPLRLHGTDAANCAICFVAALAALCSVRVFLLSFGEIAAGFCMLTAAKRYRAVGGVLCGTLTACALLLADTANAGMASMLAAAGLAAGYCAAWSNGAIFLLFQVLCGVGTLFAGWQSSMPLLAAVSASSMRTWVNLLLGGLLFVCLPAAGLADRCLHFSDADASIAALAGAKMDFLSHSIAGVRGSAERIANMLAHNDGTCRAGNRVCELVCGRCRSRATCWEGGSSDTHACFQRLERAGLAETMEGPEGCLKPEAVTGEFLRVKRQNALARTLAMRLRESQTLLFAQMRVTEELLSRAGLQMQKHYSRESTRFVTDVLARFGVPVRAAAVSVSPNQRISVELYVSEQVPLNCAAITECLADALRQPLTCTGPDQAGGDQRLLLQSVSHFAISTAAAQCAVHEDEPCGDCWDTFTDGEGDVYLVLSDGMGTGRYAAVDARIVISNFRQLVQSGMDCAAAARMVNGIMLTKSGEERFATLDVAKICTETAAVTLYKYGAGPTLLLHGGRVTLCQATTNPIGILPKVEPYTTVLRLAAGDMLFLLSDGLDDSLYPYIRERLAQGGDLQTLTHAVCAKAQRDAQGSPKDDVTVLAAAVRAQGTTLSDEA